MTILEEREPSKEIASMYEENNVVTLTLYTTRKTQGVSWLHAVKCVNTTFF